MVSPLVLLIVTLALKVPASVVPVSGVNLKSLPGVKSSRSLIGAVDRLAVEGQYHREVAAAASLELVRGGGQRELHRRVGLGGLVELVVVVDERRGRLETIGVGGRGGPRRRRPRPQS